MPKISLFLLQIRMVNYYLSHRLHCVRLTSALRYAIIASSQSSVHDHFALLGNSLPAHTLPVGYLLDSNKSFSLSKCALSTGLLMSREQ